MRLIQKGGPTHMALCEGAQMILGNSQAHNLKLQRTLLGIGEVSTRGLSQKEREELAQRREGLSEQIDQAMAFAGLVERFRMFLEEQLYVWRR